MKSNAENVLSLNNVTKTYGSVVGVEDVTVSVEAGSIFGFLGPNGAGKTTTISMLVDLLRPTKGTIRIFGMDSVKDSVAIRRKVGFLAGDMSMDRGLSGWQQLEYLGNLHGSFDRTYVTELAERLDCRLERRFNNLSRGNKQKVGLIAALMHKPELLILDEPTSGLDPLIQAEFNGLVREHKRQGKTVFISSHVLGEVQEICDTVTFIREGRIIETKSMEALGRELPKLFSVRGTNSKLNGQLEKLSGATEIEASRSAVTGMYRGDINQLLHLLTQHKVKDFSLRDADLETVFMKYYEDGEDV